jgi:hypothetical protein
VSGAGRPIAAYLHIFFKRITSLTCIFQYLAMSSRKRLASTGKVQGSIAGFFGARDGKKAKADAKNRAAEDELNRKRKIAALSSTPISKALSNDHIGLRVSKGNRSRHGTFNELSLQKAG